jgi:hypothetical protein
VVTSPWPAVGFAAAIRIGHAQQAAAVEAWATCSGLTAPHAGLPHPRKKSRSSIFSLNALVFF